MATNACPACGQPIATDDVNVKEGVALCRACGKLSRLSDVVESPDVDPQALANPPAGCWCEEPAAGELFVFASLRSAGSAMGLLFICLFWNGIVSVFVLGAAAGLYTHYVGPLPAWFPAPSGGGRGSRGFDMPLGMTWFLCVFLIPFVLVGAAIALGFLNSLFGRVEVVVSGGTDGRVRTGFGPFLWTRRFDAAAVKRVSIGQASYAQDGRRPSLIQLEADRTIKFGSTLPDERRAWMAAVLYQALVAAKRGRRGAAGMSAGGAIRR